MSSLLVVKNLQCEYQGTPVLKGVSFTLQSGEIACLLGPSGCGKTTALRAIAGFIEPRDGEIRLGGSLISRAQQVLAPEKRGMGMVFQDYALFPHLSVADNIAFGLTGLKRGERDERIAEVLEVVGLAALAKRFPHELSGGQQQRIALARALAPQPQLLLMDEPFSNLDADLRRQLSAEVRSILKSRGIAAIMVTHDQQEAFTLGDQLGVLRDGLIRQWGTPEQLYYTPVDADLAGFVGQGTPIVATRDASSVTGWSSALGAIALPDSISEQQVTLFLRAADLTLVDDMAVGVEAEVINYEFQGGHMLYRLHLNDGVELEALVRGIGRADAGDKVRVAVVTDRLVVLPN